VALGRGHAQIEQYLAQSGLADALLRHSYLMQNLHASAQTVAGQGVLYGMTGETRTNYIDTPHIAAVAARALTSSGHQGNRHTLTGPEALSAVEVADWLSAATGRQVRYVDVSPDAFGQALAGAGLPGLAGRRVGGGQHAVGGRLWGNGDR
jgi:uncharacterized protein YbjT (DUF2867 family)